jgi:hypothetical protein
MKTSKIGCAFLAALAVLVIGAGSAQAANFTAAEYPAFISGEQTGPTGTGGGGGAGSTIFGFESAQMAECESAGFAGLMTAATGSLTVSSGYNGCTAFGSAATVESNGCEFVLHPGSGSKDEFTGSFDITCPGGGKIAVVGGNCEIQIGAQNGLGPVVYKNLTAAPREVEASFQMTGGAGFAYTKAKDGTSCPLAGTGAKTDGVIVGAAKIKAGNIETLEPINFGIE